MAFRERVPGSEGYLGRLRARRWEAFATMAVSALREAEAMLRAKALPDDHEVTGYWGDGHHEVLGTTVRVPQENGITDPLVRALDIVRAGAPAAHPLKKLRVYVAQQQPRRRQRRVGSSALTTDILIRSLVHAHLDLRIEAKVLFDGGALAEYCGADGLLRFAHEEPYTDQHVGMMVGYAVRREDDHWTEGIRRRARRIACVRSVDDVALDREVTLGTRTTSHATGEVLVLHLILRFETDPSARLLDAARAAPRRARDVRRREAER